MTTARKPLYVANRIKQLEGQVMQEFAMVATRSPEEHAKTQRALRMSKAQVDLMIHNLLNRDSATGEWTRRSIEIGSH